MTFGVAESGVVRAFDVTNGAYAKNGQVWVQLDCEPLSKEIDIRAVNLGAAGKGRTRSMLG